MKILLLARFRATGSVKSWIGLLLTSILLFGAPALLSQEFGKHPFDVGPIRQLSRVDPDYIFIGNSMLGSRIDREYLSTLIGGAEVALLADGGSQSAIWYLRLKNHVVGADTSPEAVFIFFRDRTLTQPLLRTDGQYATKIERYSTDDEPIFDAVWRQNEDLGTRVRALFERVYPIQRQREDFKSGFLRLAASPIIPEILFGSFIHVFEPERHPDAYNALLERFNSLKRRTNTVFDTANRRPTSPGPSGKESQDEFSTVVDSSFLPHILGVGKESELNLVFIRVQKRPKSDGDVPQSTELTKYVHDLRAHIEENGASFHDFTGDQEVTLDWYLDGDHIGPENMKDYTRVFYDRFSDIFR